MIFLFNRFAEHQATSALATTATLAMALFAFWNETATTSLNFATEMRTALQHLVDGNAFAIKVGFFKFLNQIWSFRAMEKTKFEVPKLVARTVPVAAKKPDHPRRPGCPTLMWRSFKFTNKIIIAGSIIYYTHRHGAWGTTEQSWQFMSTLSNHIQAMSPSYIAAVFFPEK